MTDDYSSFDSIRQERIFPEELYSAQERAELSRERVGEFAWFLRG
jgi:hypothetical protein